MISYDTSPLLYKALIIVPFMKSKILLVRILNIIYNKRKNSDVRLRQYRNYLVIY